MIKKSSLIILISLLVSFCFGNDIRIEGVNYFYFLRHSKTIWIEDQLKDGFIDSPLSNEGITQSKEAAQKLPIDKIKYIISSPLKRCIETANIISERFNNIPIYVINELISRDYGQSVYISAGCAIDTLEVIPPESLNAFETRIMNSISSVLMQYGDGVLFISHGCVREVLLNKLPVTSHSLGPKTYGSPIVFEYYDDNWHARRI